MALYKLINNPLTGKIDSVYMNLDNPPHSCIPIDKLNIDYQQYLQDIKDNGMSVVSCDDCGDGVPNDSMWQYLDNAEQLIHNKYHSDPSLHDKITALREDRYVRAMKAKFPYESKDEGFKIIDSTSEEIKQKYRHLPMRR